MAAAINLRFPPRVVDTEALPKGATAELVRLVLAAKAAQPANEEKNRGRGGDVMSYSITIEEGNRSTVLKQSDTRMSPAFDALRSWLEKQTAG